MSGKHRHRAVLGPGNIEILQAVAYTDVITLGILWELFMMTGKGIILSATFAVAWLMSLPVQAQDLDTAMAWPLCGRIAEAPPVGWVDTDGCPAERWGNSDFTDLPLNSVFGPRLLVSEGLRYDFHRGIDIATPNNTPVFAVADGVVRIAGDHPSYSDPLVQLRHFRPGETSCNAGGCYHSNYLHMTSAAVPEGATVNKGDLIGYSGESASGFQHVHFEIRTAPVDDVFSNWQRDAVNPTGVLPYVSSDSASITFDSVDNSDPTNPIVEVTVESTRVDINRVELTLYDGALNEISQSGNTPNALGYNLLPAFFDMNLWNRQYTHKDSSSVPWESFGAGGENECPYHADHGPNYSAHVHMDQQDPDDFQAGLFNGVRLRPVKHVAGEYYLNLTFNALTGPASGQTQCILADVLFAAGGSASHSWGNCSGTAPTADDQSVSTDEDQPVDITLTGSSPGGNPLSYLITRQPDNGGLSGAAPDVTYTPGPGFSGADSFDFLVNDGTADSSTATVDITVNPAPLNNPPTADAQSISTSKNTPVDITLTGSDPDGDPLTYSVLSGPSNGSLTGGGNLWTYTPDNNVTGKDDFIYAIDDGRGGSDSAKVSINVRKGGGGGGGGDGGGGGGGGGPNCDAKPNHPKCQ